MQNFFYLNKLNNKLTFKMPSQNDRKHVLKTIEEIEKIIEQSGDNIHHLSENIKNMIDSLKKQKEEIVVIFFY